MSMLVAEESRRILVIDDNEAIHRDFRKTLVPSDELAALAAADAAIFGDGTPEPDGPKYEMDSAMQGEEGCLKVQQAIREGRPYALAFVDMRMPPGWDGLETVRHLFEEDPHLQVVVCTAYSDYSWEQMFETLGMTDRMLILKKPFDGMEVCQLAAALTEKWKLKRQAALKLGELEAMVHARTHELREQSLRDRLTGLPNRAYLMDKLPGIIQRGQEDPGAKYALLFLDFDRFKTINDSLGHEIGDQLLVEIAARLQGMVRRRIDSRQDAGAPFAARLGGDEFVVMLDQTSGLEDAEAFAAELQAGFSTPYNLQGYEVRISVSIGIATGETEYAAAAEVLRDADIAMYRAKGAGPGRYAHFDRSMHERAMARLTIENDMLLAIERQEFTLFYQPILSLRNAVLVGFEALIRWNHPIRGLVSPGEFIPVAEETNLIIPIGRHVLAAACKQMAQWREKLPQAVDLSVSVNLSRKQFRDPELVGLMRDLLRRHQLPAGAINLEITESVIMENSEIETSFLKEVKALGLALHMDDFGTGYSSLNCLQNLSLSCLKIDRSFISTMAGRRYHAAVINAIIQLAHNLDIRVIAEGVETKEQVVMLQTLECDYAQGYHFSVPVNPEVATAMIEGRHRLGSPSL